MIGQNNGLLRQNLVQFARSHKGTGYGSHAHGKRQAGAAALKGRGRARVGEHKKAHDGRRAAADAVQKGHHLRHLDHLDLVGQGKTQGHAYSNGKPQCGRGQRAVLEHGDKNGQAHGRGAKEVAPDRSGNLVHEAKAEQDGSHKNAGYDVVGYCIHFTAPLSSGLWLMQRPEKGYFFFPATMRSILWVMSKPPKTLTMAMATATAPKSVKKVEPAR